MTDVISSPDNPQQPNDLNTQPIEKEGATSKADTGTDQRKEVLFAAITTMISALSSLNNYLKYFSNSVLAYDLSQDNIFADQISKLILQTITAKMTTFQRYYINTKNNNQLVAQQVVQARLKAHQNQEQMDIQDASSTTTNSQQLTSIISALFQIVSQITQSILSMSR